MKKTLVLFISCFALICAEKGFAEPALVCPNGKSRKNQIAKPTMVTLKGGDLKKGRRATAFSKNFRKPVRCATGDFNSDSTTDLVLGTGPGTKTLINVLNGKNSKNLSKKLNPLLPFSANFKGGVYVATGDINGDGVADIVAGAGSGEPLVNIIDGSNATRFSSFSAYDNSFTGGVRVAVGDVNGDGQVEIITAPANDTILPRVNVFNSSGNQHSSFSAYDSSFTGGVFVAAGDVNGDGRAEIITGAGAGGGPHVRVFNGDDGTILGQFFAFDTGFSGGVSVGVADLNGDGRVEILTGTAGGNTSQLKVFDGSTLTETSSLNPFGKGFKGGVFVGSSQGGAEIFAPTPTPTSENLPSGAESFIDALELKSISDFTIEFVSGNCGFNNPLNGTFSGADIIISNIPKNSLIRFSKQSPGQYTASGVIIFDQPAHNGTLLAEGCLVNFSFLNTQTNAQCQTIYRFSPPAALNSLLRIFNNCPQ